MKKQRVIAVLLTVFALLCPFFTLASSLVLPPVYDGTYVGELGDKMERLTSLDQPKIVVIGGSSVAFGLDSETLGRAFGRPVVNFGLYADLGTKLMLDLSRAGIREGDIVILAPELNAQTLSLYDNPASTLRALDGHPSYLRYIPADGIPPLLSQMFSYTEEKIRYLLTGTLPQNSGAYRKENFNACGDNTYPRPYNIMTSSLASVSLDGLYADLDDGVTTEYERFLDYVNDYAAFVRGRGATLYYAFCPVSADARAATVTDEALLRYYQNLRSALDCPVLGNPAAYFLDGGYFYDSEFHLNDSGVPVRTAMLINDLALELGRPECFVSLSALAGPSGYAPRQDGDFTEENPYFLLHKTEAPDGSFYYEITGLTEEGKRQTALTIPAGTDGLAISAIGTGAFRGSDLQTLTLSRYITVIRSAAFAGADRLSRVLLPENANPEDISVPNGMNEDGLMTDGAPATLRFVVRSSDEVYEAFRSDYFWGDYVAYLMREGD